MQSSTHRAQAEELKQAQLREQIALLQAQLVAAPVSETEHTLRDSHDHGPSDSPPARNQVVTYAPATPSPKKKRKLDLNANGNGRAPVPSSSSSQFRPPQQLQKAPLGPVYKAPPPSSVVAKMASMTQVAKTTANEPVIPRSSAFTDAPQRLATQPPEDHDVHGNKRDDRLVLIEDLEVGPVDHTAPFDDPLFLKLEPNSGIHLSSRIISHEDVQDHLRGRYYLSPSRLYSSIRLLPDKQGYDVPVPGDWVTLAVVAERGPIKFSRAPTVVCKEEELDLNPKKDGNRFGKKPKQESAEQARGKKFVNVKLVDFGSRSRSSSSNKAVIRGDAFLTLLLFESDGFDMVAGTDGEKPKKMYKGGSRGAFESMSKLKEGDVIALLNPKVLKPFNRSADTPHPASNILAITPESAGSIAVIGRSRDLGMCAVLKKDGKVCGQWCDKRVSDVCEYHVHTAVQRQRAGRAEFSIGTSGMSSSSAPKKRKSGYDPARQWGLKPADESVGPTYVVSGHTIRNNTTDRSMFVSENIGREGQAKAARKLASKDSDRTLELMLDRDKEGMRPLMAAREMAKRLAEKEDGKTTKDKGKGKGKAKESDGNKVDTGTKRKRRSTSNSSDEEEEGAKSTARHYSANVLKNIGFDPSIKPGQRQHKLEDAEVQKKLESLKKVQASRSTIALGPRPGQKKIRSGVSAPVRTSTTGPTTATTSTNASLISTTKKTEPHELPELSDDDEDVFEGGLMTLRGKASGDPDREAKGDALVDLDED